MPDLDLKATTMGLGRRGSDRVLLWHRAARRTAAVGAVLACLAAGLLLANHLGSGALEPLTAPRMLALKDTLAKQPEDRSLKEGIRRLDRRVREDYFGRKAFAGQGNLLLLGSVLLFLASAKIAKQLGKRVPKPSPLEVEDTWSSAGRGRRSVAVAGVVATLGLAAMALGSRRDVALEYAKAVGVTGQRVRAASGYPSAQDLAANWPMFRGPGARGTAGEGRFPTRWDGAKGQGILWKAPVPLPGKNSPVVWGGRVFCSGADEKQREVYCFDANSGKLLWKGALGMAAPAGAAPGGDASAPSVPEDTGYAACTMAVDGRRVYAVFATGHLGAFDLEGTLVWMRNLGTPDNMYGHASSLAMWRDRLIVQYDQGAAAEDGKSALLALDSATGETVWEAKRPVPNSWSTPIVADTGKGEQIVASGSPWVIAYDPATGKETWRADCLGGDVAPTPVHANGVVYVANTGSNAAAIRTGGTGDVTRSGVVWTAQDGLPDIISPLCAGDLLFLTMSEGLVTCLAAADGRLVWEHDFMTSFRSSPTLVGGTIYLTDLEGVTRLFEAGRTFKDVGTANLGEDVESTPAFVGGRIYIRGKSNLYCIGR
ncbi:MAG: PQQ-binding-like beta-propeller repeat protein [Armatimonadetes bacterium]|nr:PQQ-binding-like beta-propeller repeat protein [Armatimonadota bacterium]